MTIAACYVSPEGVVLGADSTSTYVGTQNGNHYFNHGQKLFEVGEDSNFGIVTWGLGGLPTVSYRTLIARLADELKNNPPATVEAAAATWCAMFWASYDANPLIDGFRQLAARPAHDPAAAVPAAGARSPDEEKQFKQLQQSLVVGFCFAGCSPTDKTPGAFEIIFDPRMAAQPASTKVEPMNFWGAPNFMSRLLYGIDMGMRSRLLASGKWTGTEAELNEIIRDHVLTIFTLPMREAVDFVYSSIVTTIKALKFSSLSQICGGPVEIAVITSDRKFRWVRHKSWDSAIREGEAE